MSVRIPVLSLVLGFGPVLLLGLAALVAWAGPEAWRRDALVAGWLWGTAILFFLAGVERGLSFRPDDTSAPRQVVAALALFGLALAAFVAPPPANFVLLACGYGGVGLADRRASEQGRAPPHFAPLRPLQAAIAVPALLLLMARAAALV